MKKMEKLNDYVNLDEVDNLQDYIQIDNCILTRINKIILDGKSENVRMKLYNKEFNYDYEYDYEYDNDMDVNELQGHILDYLSDEIGYLILELEITIKKSQRNIRNEKIILLGI